MSGGLKHEKSDRRLNLAETVATENDHLPGRFVFGVGARTSRRQMSFAVRFERHEPAFVARTVR